MPRPLLIRMVFVDKFHSFSCDRTAHRVPHKYNGLVGVLSSNMLYYLNRITYQDFLREFCLIVTVVTAVSSEVKGHTCRVVGLIFDDGSKHGKGQSRVPSTMQAQEYMTLRACVITRHGVLNFIHRVEVIIPWSRIVLSWLSFWSR